MLKLVLPMTMAVTAGLSLVVQQALNSNLRVALNSAAWSGFMSYFVGLVCMILLAIALRDPVICNDLAHSPLGVERWGVWCDFYRPRDHACPTARRRDVLRPAGRRSNGRIAYL